MREHFYVCNTIQLSNGLLFFERCSVITMTVCAYKLNKAHSENLFEHSGIYETTSFEKEQYFGYIYIF